MTTTLLTSSPPLGYNDNPRERDAILAKVLDGYSNEKGRPNFGEAFGDHPDWLTQLGWGSGIYKARAYAQLAHLKKRRQKSELNGGPSEPPSRVPKPPGKRQRHQWTEEQVSLVRQIQRNPPVMRGNGGVNWGASMAARPDWAKSLRFDKPKAFRAFLGRLARKPNFKGTKGATVVEASPVHDNENARALVPTNGAVLVVGIQDVIEIQGRQIAVKDILKKLEDYTAKLCPECGLNVQMFNTAYNVARRHSAHLQTI